MGGLLTADLAAAFRSGSSAAAPTTSSPTPPSPTCWPSRGIVFAPDFMVNCGGVIQVAEELVGGDLERARARTARVRGTTLRVLERAASEGITPVAAAEREAEDRIAAAAASRHTA